MHWEAIAFMGPEIFVMILCLVGSAFYSASEAALMSVGIDRAKQLMEEGGRKSELLRFMTERSHEILTLILIGNNLVNTLIAAVMTSLATSLFDSGAIGIATGMATILVLIFGEILPKTFARTHAETLAFPFLRILRLNYYLFYPLIKTSSFFLHFFLGKNAQVRGRIVTKDDIEFMVNRAEKEKTIDSKQLELLNSILEFPTIKVKDIMINRNKVNKIDLHATFDEIMKFMKEMEHSRYPVSEGDLDNTVGFLHAKDMAFVNACDLETFHIEKYLKPPFFVYEHMKIQSVFDHMNRKKIHLALVKDENGLVVGIITLEDIIEEILGDIEDEHDTPDETTNTSSDDYSLSDGIVVEGLTSLRDLYNDYDVKIPLNDNFSTLAGFLLDVLGNTFPEKGQLIVWHGFTFELKTVENFEIKEVFIRSVTNLEDEHEKKSEPIEA